MTGIDSFYKQPDIQTLRTESGVDLSYWVAGEGMPVLVLPGFPFSHLTIEWEVPAVQHFYHSLIAGHRVSTFDWRGSGLSSRSIDDVSLEAHCADMYQLMHRLGPGPFAIVAPRLASMLGVHFAAHHPDLVSHLVLLHPVICASDHFQNPDVRARLSLRTVDWNAYADIIALAYLGWGDASRRERQAEVFRRSISPDLFDLILDAAEGYDVTPDVPQVKAPTLILHRVEFPLQDLEKTSDIVRKFPNAQLVVLEGGLAPLVTEDLDILGPLEAFLCGAANVAGAERPRIESRLPGDRSSLSLRETELLALLAAGLSNREIASRLGLSIFTVQRHIANIYEKIGSHNRAEATAFAFRHRLLNQNLQPIENRQL